MRQFDDRAAANEEFKSIGFKEESKYLDESSLNKSNVMFDQTSNSYI